MVLLGAWAVYGSSLLAMVDIVIYEGNVGLSISTTDVGDVIAAPFFGCEKRKTAKKRTQIRFRRGRRDFPKDIRKMSRNFCRLHGVD
jgi:hypothetical protein